MNFRPETEQQWRTRIDTLIACGWGDTPQDEIPANWREMRGPDKSFGAEAKAAFSEGQAQRWKRLHRAPHGSVKRARLEETAARMRARVNRESRQSKRKAALVRWDARRA